VEPQSHHPGSGIVIDPQPLIEISPHLYTQFMEPLGTTDASVEAAWDYDDRPAVVINTSGMLMKL
jgi:hypothetical protein